ncbi:MAG: serine kinase [Dictyoglomus sp. NZ13-RE01]|nr:MAG: serine kinase [Dictyoglomus sp. NZ13-RE01]
MKSREIANILSLKVIVEPKGDEDIKYGICCDLLSFVMAHAVEESVWVTVQTHLNTVAVAVLTGIKSIIFVSGQEPGEETINKAKEEGINLYSSPKSAFEIVGELYKLGVKGEERKI